MNEQEVLKLLHKNPQSKKQSITMVSDFLVISKKEAEVWVEEKQIPLMKKQKKNRCFESKKPTYFYIRHCPQNPATSKIYCY